MPPHGDEEQVQLDVNRSFVYYPNCKFLSPRPLRLPLTYGDQALSKSSH
jgi:hypothetical protein